MLKKVKVEIKGKTALLMNRFPMEQVEKMEKKPKEEQAEVAAYRDPQTKELYVPGINIQRAFITGATFSKGKGRASLQKEVAAGVTVYPERISLGTKTYEVDSRPVVVPATKGRVVRHRPRLDKWKLSFEIEYDNDLLSGGQMRRVVDDTCERVGFLDFRPEKKGPFGKAMVVKWKDE